jgi:hypothetical protein
LAVKALPPSISRSLRSYLSGQCVLS